MLEDIAAIAPKVPVVELRSLLGCFMFSGDDVFKTLGVLSGGERNRYAMAKMLVSPANMLLLDEPTNHLDLRAKDVLLEAIANFTGTVLFVSHDRYFIDGLATRVFEVEDRRVHIYPGNYEDYLYRKAGGPEKTAANLKLGNATKPGAPHLASEMWDRSATNASVAAPTPNGVILSEALRAESKDPDTADPTSTANTVQPQTPQKRLNPIKQKQLEDRLTQVEQEIPNVESEIAAAEQSLAHFTSAADSQRTAAQLDALRTQRQTLLAEWESLALTLETQSTPA
jgi:ATP-binding cassette subfamily F protein 3